MEAVKSTLKAQLLSSDFLNDECSDIIYFGTDKSSIFFSDAKAQKHIH